MCNIEGESVPDVCSLKDSLSHRREATTQVCVKPREQATEIYLTGAVKENDSVQIPKA